MGSCPTSDERVIVAEADNFTLRTYHVKTEMLRIQSATSAQCSRTRPRCMRNNMEISPYPVPDYYLSRIVQEYKIVKYAPETRQCTALFGSALRRFGPPAMIN